MDEKRKTWPDDVTKLRLEGEAALRKEALDDVIAAAEEARLDALAERAEAELGAAPSVPPDILEGPSGPSAAPDTLQPGAATPQAPSDAQGGISSPGDSSLVTSALAPAAGPAEPVVDPETQRRRERIVESYKEHGRVEWIEAVQSGLPFWRNPKRVYEPGDTKTDERDRGSCDWHLAVKRPFGLDQEPSGKAPRQETLEARLAEAQVALTDLEITADADRLSKRRFQDVVDAIDFLDDAIANAKDVLAGGCSSVGPVRGKAPNPTAGVRGETGPLYLEDIHGPLVEEPRPYLGRSKAELQAEAIIEKYGDNYRSNYDRIFGKKP